MNKIVFYIALCVFIQCVLAKQTGVVIGIDHKPNRWLKEIDPAEAETLGYNPKISLPGGISLLGEFYATIRLGTPGQTLAVQVDTGSSDLLVYGPTCNGCGFNPYYDPKLSSTDIVPACNSFPLKCGSCGVSPPNSCNFKDSYGDGSSVSGYIIQDNFTVGGYSAKAYFGNINVASGGNGVFEPSQISGIWGLAFQSLSSTNAPTAYSQLAAASNGALAPAFSMCLKEGGGYMILGGDFSSVNYQYVTLTSPNPLYYSVTIDDVLVAGQSIGLSPSYYNQGSTPSIVDSGTTLVIIPSVAYTAIKSRFRSMCSSSVNLVGVCGVLSGFSIFDGYCFVMTSTDMAQYPPIQIVMDGIGPLTISPSTYLYTQNSNGRTYRCLGFADGGSAGVILGDVFMENYEVVFDMANLRVGFATGGACGNDASTASISIALFITALIACLFM